MRLYRVSCVVLASNSRIISSRLPRVRAASTSAVRHSFDKVVVHISSRRRTKTQRNVSVYTLPRGHWMVHQHPTCLQYKAKRVSKLLKANRAKVIVGSGSSRRIKVAPMFRLASLFCQNLNGPFLNLEFSLSWMRAFISHNAINLPRWRNGYSKKTNSSSSICSYVKFLVPLLRDNVVWIQSQRRPCERSPPPPWLPVLRSRHAAILSSLDACIILWLCHQVFETQWWRTNILEKPKKVSCCCCCCWRPTKRKLITEMRFFRHDESGSN